ncbi:hypothetical protein B0T24DRAFT_628576 [Lasiosphaeria ovina]|uniref:Uncharacterized protein n=1 Tax=Lasiosphaeria ovina TaxID=92902 RepID=A0AAE0K782_9PEZI|nr:hypothetical protein B0T24DRAFT_628576 [Lasiosphaeria ovina]
MAPGEPRWLRAPRQVTLGDYFPPEFRNDPTPAAATSRAEEPAAERGPEEKAGAATEPGPENVNDTDELQITFDQIFANGTRLGLASSPFFPNTAADFAKLQVETMEAEATKLKAKLANMEANIAAKKDAASSLDDVPADTKLTSCMNSQLPQDGRSAVLSIPLLIWSRPDSMAASELIDWPPLSQLGGGVNVREPVEKIEWSQIPPAIRDFLESIDEELN